MIGKGYYILSKSSGFTIAEALFVVSAISFLLVIIFASIHKNNQVTVPNKLSSDFVEIQSIIQKYSTTKNKYPCHAHDLSNKNEIIWSSEIKEAWPNSPFDTFYFISHTGDLNNPTLNDYYYIGVALDQKDALKFDQMYDDSNLKSGKFVQIDSPLTHYSYKISFIMFDSHSHCKP